MQRTIIDDELGNVLLRQYESGKTIKSLAEFCRADRRPLGHDRITKFLRESGVLRTSALSRKGRGRKPISCIRKCDVIGCDQQFMPNSGSQKFCKSCIPHTRARVVYATWKLSWPKFQAMFDSQHGRCAGCNCFLTQGIKKTLSTLCVDHDHKTGLIRGLLCHRCNTILGHASDNPLTLRTLATYVERKSDDDH